MRSVKYGTKTIEYTILESRKLDSHYISVARDSGVVLKGKLLNPETADKLVLKKASWILKKLEAVGSVEEDHIVTGSRIPYLGKTYYTEVIYRPGEKDINIEFNYSRFKIYTGNQQPDQEKIKAALENYYKQKAIEKITPRFTSIATKTKHRYKSLQFRKMSKRWGSCTGDNKIILNIDAVKLPYTLIDYLIIHELCHTKIKDHSKAFYAELSRHVRNWRALDDKMREMKM